MSYGEMTPADFAAVTRNESNGFGGDGSWWIIILFLFVFLGWGNGYGGWGNGAGGGAQPAATQADIQRGFDTNSIINKLNGLENGLCDGFYAQNSGLMGQTTTMLQGFDRITNNTNQGFAGLNTAIVTQGYENRNAVTGIGTQLASCCCDVRSDLAGVNYNMATQANAIMNQMNSCCCESQRQVERGFCDTNYNAATNTTSIIQNAHSDADRIIARLDQMESARQQERIAQLQAENQGLKFEASQNAQNAFITANQAAQTQQIINAVNPQAVPAYIVCNPHTGQYYSQCNCNSCC